MPPVLLSFPFPTMIGHLALGGRNASMPPPIAAD